VRDYSLGIKLTVFSTNKLCDPSIIEIIRIQRQIMWYTTMLMCFYIIYKPYQINAIKTPEKNV